MAIVEILERRRWDRSELLFLIGPGGAGKSSAARCLAPLLGRDLIDLDRQFTERIAPIDRYIREAGYPAYKAANSAMAGELVAAVAAPVLFVTSSGFLADDNPAGVLQANRMLIARGYSLSLRPSADIAITTEVIVERQLGRGFGLERERETRKIRQRFGTYSALGDMLVTSVATAQVIADSLAIRLHD